MIKSWLREPLVHFLLIGFALFAISGLLGTGTSPGGRAIVIGPGEVEPLKQQFAARWMRPPTREELHALIDDEIREEILYREALALGLDRDDVILRRRLAQKMEFLIADTAEAAQPSEAQLRAYLADNASRYAEPPKLSFTHIYFSTDLHVAAAKTAAERVLQQLQRPLAPERAPELGDRFALHYDYAARSPEELDQEFGAGFAKQVLALMPGRWGGPVDSGYGLHLVRVTERTTPHPAVFEQVRERVKDDFQFEERRQANEEAYRRLRAIYTVTVDLPADVRGVAAGSARR